MRGCRMPVSEARPKAQARKAELSFTAQSLTLSSFTSFHRPRSAAWTCPLPAGFEAIPSKEYLATDAKYQMSPDTRR